MHFHDRKRREAQYAIPKHTHTYLPYISSMSQPTWTTAKC